MQETEVSFEVEIRYYFNDAEEAYRRLPFLKSSFDREITWTTRHYGLDLFKKDLILRISDMTRANGLQHSLGWKGRDIGKYANIREEVDEDISHGIIDSTVLKLLGGNADIPSPENVARELDRLGHLEFMSFHGRNLLGYDKSLGIATKLMNCPDINWPCIVEIEKTAHTEPEAVECEIDLMGISRKFSVGNRLVRAEPPTLLYRNLFGKLGT
jgi:hypothetical protein